MDIGVFEVTDLSKKREVCREIILALPDWFGIPTANENYIRDIADKDVFAATTARELVGAIALRFYFNETAEIWWLGIKPTHHRQGIGVRLFSAALDRASKKACKWMVVQTLSPQVSDEHYAGTRAFYQKVGLKPLLSFNESDPENPMIWMIRPL